MLQNDTTWTNTGESTDMTLLFSPLPLRNLTARAGDEHHKLVAWVPIALNFSHLVTAGRVHAEERVNMFGPSEVRRAQK